MTLQSYPSRRLCPLQFDLSSVWKDRVNQSTRSKTTARILIAMLTISQSFKNQMT